MLVFVTKIQINSYLRKLYDLLNRPTGKLVLVKVEKVVMLMLVLLYN